MQTIKYQNINWLYKHGALIPGLPPHKKVDLSCHEQKELLILSKAYFIRYNTTFDDEKGPFWYVVKDSFQGLEELSSNTRSKVRRGSKKYYTSIVDKSVLLAYGYRVYVEASRRYETFERMMNEDEFKEYITALDTSYEFWGVFDKDTGNLAAYSQNFIQHGSCFYEELFFTPLSLKKYSSYLLFYDMNKYYLQEKNFRYVHDGSRSLSHDTSIHQFLEKKFKFRKAYAKIELVYRSDVKLAVKLLYPLRSFIYRLRHDIFKKISVLLAHEAIRRGCEK
ncbi:MAG: hypothetical protein ACQERD_11330 [Campylobacterota bacterium]